jgi:putative aldouronate transport system substrate-binding protein
LETNNSQKLNSSEPYEIVIYYPGAGLQPDVELIEEEASKLLQDMNVTIRLNCILASDWQNKKRMILNSGEKADLVFTASWDEYFEEIGRNSWIPLNDLVDMYGADIKSTLAQEQLKAATVNGKLYAIPVNKEFGATYGLLFNKRLVEKHNINIKSIKSLKDLEKVLDIIKQTEPEIIPFLLDGYGTPLRIVYMNNYEAIGSDTSAGAIRKDGVDYTVVNQYEQQDMIEAAQMVYSWNLKGYFNQFTDQHANADAIKKIDNYFCLMSPLKPGKDKEMTQQYGIEFVQHSWGIPYADTRECTGAMMSIPKSCENPEITMAFLNRLYKDKDLVNLIVNGIEGKHYVKIDDDIIDYPEGVDANNSGYLPLNNWKIGSQFLDFIWIGEDPDKWVKFKEFNDMSVKSRIMGFTYTSKEVGVTENKVTEIVAKYFTLYSTGQLNPGNTYNDFLWELEDADVDKVIAEKQRQLDSWLSLISSE